MCCVGLFSRTTLVLISRVALWMRETVFDVVALALVVLAEESGVVGWSEVLVAFERVMHLVVTTGVSSFGCMMSSV